jgi:DtxR family transcriptional regulator, Mn-dependent transcriptional regulator
VCLTYPKREPKREEDVSAAAGTTGADGIGGVEAEALSASLEDYLEAILQLERDSRVARVSEIAGQLGVSRPSVTGALKHLGARQLITHVRYGHVTLTQQGARIALEVERRHVAIRGFLTGVLGIPLDRAEITACKLEHILEPEVLEYFMAHAERCGCSCEPGEVEA